MSDSVVKSFRLEVRHDLKLAQLATKKGSNKSAELRRILDLYFNSRGHVEDELKEEINKLDEKIEAKKEEFSTEIEELKDERAMLENRLEELQSVNDDGGEGEDSDFYEVAINTLKEDVREGLLSEGDIHSFPPLQHWASKLDLSKEELFERVKDELKGSEED